MHGNVELVTQGEIWVKKWWVVWIFAVFLLNNALFFREKRQPKEIRQNSNIQLIRMGIIGGLFCHFLYFSMSEI